MSQNGPVSYLVTYDIADPRRLGRLFRFLKKQGLPIQYSVFLVDATAMQMGSLMVKVAKMIHPDADDVRAYRLPENGWQITLGASILPTDILPGNTKPEPPERKYAQKYDPYEPYWSSARNHPIHKT